MKYILIIFLSLINFSANAELDCLLSENILKQECKNKRVESAKKKQAGYLDEEYQEDKWTVRVFQHDGKDSSDWSILASVNGKITHGDRFVIRILPKNIDQCDIGNSFTTFYTAKNNKNFPDLSGVIPATLKSFNSDKISFVEEIFPLLEEPKIVFIPR